MTGPRLGAAGPSFLCLTVLGLATLLLFVFWSFAVPIFESPDEPQHWLNARYIHDHLRLPPYDTVYYEGNQGPLYYILLAPLAFNDPGPPRASCGPRLFLNCSADLWKFWPIRLARFLTALISLATVLFTILAAFEATQQVHLGVLAGALVACLPQFSYRASTVSNDALVAASSAAATYFLVRFLKDHDWRMAWWCSLATGAALLSKLNSAMLPVVLGASILAAPFPWKVRLSRLRVLLLAAAIVLPWLIRNWFVYGDPFGESAMLRTIPGLAYPRSIRSPYFRTTFPRVVFQSFVGYFGWLTLYLNNWVYNVAAAIGAVAGLGVLWGVIRRKFRTGIVLALLALILGCGALLVKLNLTFPQAQGRLLFPGLSPLMVLLAMGFGALPKWNRICTGLVVAAVLALNVYIVTAVIIPVFWKPVMPREYVDLFVSDLLMKKPAPPITEGHRFSLSFVSQHDNLHAIEVEVTHYGDTPRQGVIHLSLRPGGIMVPPIAVTDVPASKIATCCLYARLEFPPILDSREKLYYLSLETKGLAPADLVTVFLSDRLVYPPGRFYFDWVPVEQNTSFRAFYLEPPAVCPVCLKAGGS